MSENKFTPGPWLASEFSDLSDTIDPYYIYVDPNIAVVERGIGREETDMANARLIAAAPDLLEALEAVLLVVGQLRIGEHLPCDQGMNVTKLCMAAIARARGES